MKDGRRASSPVQMLADRLAQPAEHERQRLEPVDRPLERHRLDEPRDTGIRHERPYLTDASLARGQTVRACRAGSERVVPDAPPPTWETVERFLRDALSR